MALERELHNPLTDSEASSLTDEEKDWLRSWNREGEIPGEDASAALDPLDPNGRNREDRINMQKHEEESASKYDGWSNSDLSDELEKRGLPKSGNKAEMIERLEEDDAANVSDDDSDESDDDEA